MDTGSRFFCSVDILPDYYSFYHCSFERFEQIERAFYSEHYDDYCEAQQEKALEALGFELPYPDQKPGKMNNRKKTFDAACREMFFDICRKHGLHLDHEPEYGGRAYLEKQDYILMRQKERKVEADQLNRSRRPKMTRSLEAER